MSQTTIDQPKDHSRPKEAGFVPHVLASIVDVLVTLVVPALAVGILIANYGSDPRGNSSTASLVGLIWSITFVLYSLYFDRTPHQTLGKKVLGLRVVAKDGSVPKPPQILARSLIKGIEMFLPASYWFFARSQGGFLFLLVLNGLSSLFLSGFIHDVLTGTVVTKPQS